MGLRHFICVGSRVHNGRISKISGVYGAGASEGGESGESATDLLGQPLF